MYALTKLLLAYADRHYTHNEGLDKACGEYELQNAQVAKSMQGSCTFHAGDVLRHAITPQKAFELHIALPALKASMSQQH